MSNEPSSNGHHEVEITIDGESYVAPERRETVSQILALAGKSADAFELIEIKGKREREPLPDPNETVELQRGAAFITVPLGPTPVS